MCSFLAKKYGTGWMDGWMDEQLGGWWMDGWIDGWVDADRAGLRIAYSNQKFE